MENTQNKAVEPTVTNTDTEALLSEEALSEVTGGKNSIRKGLIEEFEADNTNKANLDGLDNRTHDSKVEELNKPEIAL